MLKNKYFIILAIMILGTCFITALDNKKADTVAKPNVGQQIIDLSK